jgi:hypothetical protein
MKMKRLWIAPWLAAVILSLAASSAWAAAGFEEIAPMNVDREAQTTTLLPSGEVLVAGGQGDLSQTLDSAELFNPTTERFTATEDLTVPRLKGTATLLRNGKVLVAGGENDGASLKSAELYDPSGGTWSPAAEMPSLRADAGAVRLSNGNVLVVGGSENTVPVDTAVIYDPTTDTWSPTANDLAVPHRLPGVAMLPDGKVLVVGGIETGFSATAAAEIYDPATNEFTPTAPMAKPRTSFAIATLPDGQVLVAGGNAGSWADPQESAEVFDPVSETWTPVEAPLTQRTEASAVVLEDGSVLLNEWEETAERFDPASETWEVAGKTVEGRIEMGTVRLADGRVLLTGGCNCGASPFPTAELYTAPTTATADPSVSFGDQFVGYRSPTVNFRLENTGGNALWPTHAELSGADAADFAIGGNDCVDQRVAPGGHCTIQLRVTASGTGPLTALLKVEDNESGGSHSVVLQAEGVAPPTGPEGRPGADGAEGKPGAAGSAGPKGDVGTPGPAGPAGPAAKVTCTSKVQPTKAKSHVVTSCKVMFAAPLDRAARVSIRAAGKTYGHATAPKGHREVGVTFRGRAKGGHYTVAVG